MAIKLIEFASPDGMSERVCVSVADFADDQQVQCARGFSTQSLGDRCHE